MLGVLDNPYKQPFDGDETIIVLQPWDCVKELVMPPLKIFDLAPFPLAVCLRCYLHISYEVVRRRRKKKGGKKQTRSIVGRLAV